MGTNVKDYAGFHCTWAVLLYYHKVKLCSVQCIDETKGLADMMRLYRDNHTKLGGQRAARRTAWRVSQVRMCGGFSAELTLAQPR